MSEITKPKVVSLKKKIRLANLKKQENYKREKTGINKIRCEKKVLQQASLKST